MASLNAFLTRRQLVPLEDNQEEGRTDIFSIANVRNNWGQYGGFIWKAPGTGRAVIEAWGAGGSGIIIPCCGGQLPGNTGAYVKKTLCVNSNTCICGLPGFACTGSNTCCLGITCSCYTGLCWNNACDINNNTDGCICAEGGTSGFTYCIDGNAGSIFCCYRTAGFCTSIPAWITTAGCGTVCNQFSGRTYGSAYGGDVNCSSMISCSTFLHCNACCDAYYTYHHHAVPPGIISSEGSYLTYVKDWEGNCASIDSNVAGLGFNQFLQALSVASRTPTMGYSPRVKCYTYSGACAGYQAHGCFTVTPPGIGAPATYPVINYSCAVCGFGSGFRGGHGFVKIKYLDY